MASSISTDMLVGSQFRELVLKEAFVSLQQCSVMVGFELLQAQKISELRVFFTQQKMSFLLKYIV